MNKSKEWVRVTAVENIPQREGRSVRIAGHELAIFNLGGRFLAVQNQCPHRGGPLADGIVSGSAVVCPLHAWKIELDTGTVSRPADVEACVETYRVREESGVLLVELPVHSEAQTQLSAMCLATGESSPAVPAPPSQ
jgi:nitrite reductase [NAD(P)H] small subunit